MKRRSFLTRLAGFAGALCVAGKGGAKVPNWAEDVSTQIRRGKPSGDFACRAECGCRRRPGVQADRRVRLQVGRISCILLGAQRFRPAAGRA